MRRWGRRRQRPSPPRTRCIRWVLEQSTWLHIGSSLRGLVQERSPRPHLDRLVELARSHYCRSTCRVGTPRADGCLLLSKHVGAPKGVKALSRPLSIPKVLMAHRDSQSTHCARQLRYQCEIGPSTEVRLLPPAQVGRGVLGGVSPTMTTSTKLSVLFLLRQQHKSCKILQLSDAQRCTRSSNKIPLGHTVNAMAAGCGNQ